ncbi:type II toxin-antitoxin system RelE/ParE family toxin [Tautonia rosea]|uniref:type II toxin-antitoxin system RelE/ParE family toxin n=1 Tax=Tautonia rosea TaxID=2728037 RepID=UPI001474110A|nr:type II toxin-antitoxin system RelE/ParE family toxin [Tautonia rosea]
MIVRWTESALADLEAIEAFIARHSPRYARAMVGRIFQRCEQIAALPGAGPMVPEFEDATLREVFEHPYRIVYQLVDEERIDVVAVVHGARRLPHM